MGYFSVSFFLPKAKRRFFSSALAGLREGGSCVLVGTGRETVLRISSATKRISSKTPVQNTGLDKVHKRNPDNRGDDESGYARDAHAGVHGEQHLQRRESGCAAENPRLKDAADDVENAVKQQELCAHFKQTQHHADCAPRNQHRSRAEERNKIQKRENQRNRQRIRHADDEEGNEDNRHIQQRENQLGAKKTEYRRSEAVSHQADGVFAACAEIVVDVLAQVGKIRRDDAARQNQNGQEDDKLGTSSAMLRVMPIA